MNFAELHLLDYVNAVLKILLRLSRKAADDICGYTVKGVKITQNLNGNGGS